MNKTQKKYKIISVDGERILKDNRQFNIRTENGAIDFAAFEGYLDYSLETIQLKKIYNAHKKEFAESFAFFSSAKAKGKCPSYFLGYTLALINVSFDHLYRPQTSGKTFDTKAVRELLYEKGFDCDGVHYVRYKRSAGSSREGQCLFIPEILYPEMKSWSCCGIDESTITDQASFQAYISLTLSSIEKPIELSKKEILIIPDQYSVFSDKAVVVENNKNNKLDATERMVEIKNTIWDGEALLDESVFAENGYANKGMMLLRNRFFKTCAFNTKLQKWFADNGITDIKQLAGCHRRGAELSDIKLVITESSLKYCKMLPGAGLQEIFDRWIDATFEGNTSDFGLVKTEKATGFMEGRMVRTNYQFLNTLGLTREESEAFLVDSIDYIHKILRDPMYMRYYISLFGRSEYDEPLTDDAVTTENYRAKAVLEMLKCRDDFAKTRFYCDFRGDVRRSFKNKLKNGRVQVNGTYTTLFGNGAEFLRAVIDKTYQVDEPLALKDNEIRTTQFAFEKDLVCARSPHITMGNVFLARNVDNAVYSEYFNFNNAHEIVCINAIRHNIQQRLNGCDYDSDTMLITDNEILLNAARRNANHFPVPVANLSGSGKKREYDAHDPIDMARLDISIANNRIGEIVNLSQFLNSLYWDKIARGSDHGDEDCKALYRDICKLAVLSGIEIDKAKHPMSVNSYSVIVELQKRKRAYKEANGGELPEFYRFITEKEVVKAKARLETTMAYIYEIADERVAQAPRVVNHTPLHALVSLNANDKDSNDSKRKKKVLDAVKEASQFIKCNSIKLRERGRRERSHLREIMDERLASAIEVVSDQIVNDHVLSLILKELDSPEEVNPYYALLFGAVLFESNQRYLERARLYSDRMFDLHLTSDESAPILIYGHPHKKVAVD